MGEPKIAIAHDQFYTYGGAERVAVEMSRALDAPIFTMRRKDGVGPDEADIRVLDEPGLRSAMGRHYLVEDAYQMLAWSQVDLTDYDVVIENKTNPYWYVPEDDQAVVRYVHSTPRGLYDLYHYQGKGWVSSTMKIVQRALYSQVLPYADLWAANSDLVAARLGKYFDIEHASVLYPPVDTGPAEPSLEETGDHVLYIGRLAGNKRIGLVREYAEQTDREVRVAGDGPKRGHVEGGPDNLEYLGHVEEDRKWRELSAAGALLFPAENEDFGIVPIEALASGTPVVAVDEGFTSHQITNGENGRLVRPIVDSIERGVADVLNEGVGWSEEEMTGFAERFNGDRFHEGMRGLVKEARSRAEVTAEWES